MALTHSTTLVQTSSTTIHGVTVGFDPAMPKPYFARIDWQPVKWFYSGAVAHDWANQALAAKVLDKLFASLTATPDNSPQPLTIDDPQARRFIESGVAYFEYLSLLDNGGDDERACTISRSASCELKRRERLMLQDSNTLAMITHSKAPELTIPELTPPTLQTELLYPTDGTIYNPARLLTAGTEEPNHYQPKRRIIVGKIHFITTDEFAQMHNISPAAARKLCQRGRIPGAEKFGRSWLIPLKAAQDYVPRQPGRPKGG